MVAARGIRRELRPLTAAAAAALPGQLGVFELVDAGGHTVRIGQAGGSETFGLRSALEAVAAERTDLSFRYECTHGYRSRWQELLMLHHTEHGELPPENVDDERLIGRLR